MRDLREGKKKDKSMFFIHRVWLIGFKRVRIAVVQFEPLDSVSVYLGLILSDQERQVNDLCDCFMSQIP